jgi:hypothetical protein
MFAVRWKVLGIMLGVMCVADVAHAQLGVGTWVRQGKDPVGSMTMKVEACCRGGYKLTYDINMGGTNHVMTVESPFDGTEVPVLIDGKASAETMAITRVDSHHTSTTLKTNGKLFGYSKSTLSADGTTLTVVNDMKAFGAPQSKELQTEIWKKK